ncbi:MAG: PrsW family glutamic-type intramembrane protease [Anaerolineales bacterium]|nr:PrsW family intramembrane metalloprotease [Anaerolineales bacterium]MDW8445754.1 PrsW family glutamic-type intramembrane protease [Anaerolineales bacterium]
MSKKISVWQALGTSLAAFFVINLALGFLLYSFLELVPPSPNVENAVSLLLLASGFFTAGLLLIPPTVLSFCRSFGWKVPVWITSLRLPPFALLVAAYPLVLLGGALLSSQTLSAYLALPVFHIAAIGIPVAAVLQISLRGVRDVSPQRKWGALSVGLILTPLLILILELFAFIFPGALLGIWASIEPERLRQLSRLSETLGQPSTDPQVVLEALQPYLVEPAVVLILLFFAALVVPLIEEAIKPLAVWMLYGHTRSTLDGFVAGALCGAGYALLESFMLGSNPSQWLLAVLGRSGTGALHIFTSALVGAALASVWQNRRYIQLILAYLTAVFFHGVWNSFAVLSALRSISPTTEGFWALPLSQNLALVAPLAIIALAGLGMIGLWLFNQQLRQGHQSTSQELIQQ